MCDYLAFDCSSNGESTYANKLRVFACNYNSINVCCLVLFMISKCWIMLMMFGACILTLKKGYEHSVVYKYIFRPFQVIAL